jgi:chromosome segregation ATPase
MKEDQMSILEHPSIAGRIALLESEAIAKQENIDSLTKQLEEARSQHFALRSGIVNYELKIQKVLQYVADELDGDIDTIKNIAEQAEIDLTTTKSYELNVTINIDIEVPFGEDGPDTADIESDIDVSIDSYNHTITDYSTDPIFCNEA